MFKQSMTDTERWIVTFGTIIESEHLEYAAICDYLQEMLLEELRKCFPDIEAIDDVRDGEAYSVRFSMSAIPQPPKTITIRRQGKEYELERLEIGPEREIYPDQLRSLLDEYVRVISANRVPFDQISLYLLFQAINALEQQLFEGTVLLCRSVIENSLYLACIYRITDNNSGDQDLEMVLPKAFIDKKKDKEKAKVYWPDILKGITERSILDKTKLDEIYGKVIEKGNFAAHISQRQIYEYKNWLKKYKPNIDKILKEQQQGHKVDSASFPPGYKLRTSSTEATSALEAAINFLIELAIGYTGA